MIGGRLTQFRRGRAHKTVAAATKLARCAVALARSGGYTPNSRHSDLTESYREHAAIVDAFRSSDKRAAVNALKENIQ